MSALPAPKTYTVEQYLDLERNSMEGKCEFVDGQIFAMASASREHNLIGVNISGELRNQLKGRPCEAYANDMRVKAAEAKGYHYPDISVVCGKPEFEDGQMDTLLNPAVLVEILSSSTEAYDRGDKFSGYRKIHSLREYILVSQDKPLIERYIRQGDAWVLTETEGLDGVVNVETIGCVLAMIEVYDRVFYKTTGD
ncbi:MAG: Uma2 family endonuclease [Proteobacteria bacterium]|nr:Uma2 family endonuclease [Pseudomonadota bacterium]